MTPSFYQRLLRGQTELKVLLEGRLRECYRMHRWEPLAMLQHIVDCR